MALRDWVEDSVGPATAGRTVAAGSCRPYAIVFETRVKRPGRASLAYPLLDGLLLQSQHFAACQEANRLFQTLVFRFLALGGLDPSKVSPALLGRQSFEVA